MERPVTRSSRADRDGFVTYDELSRPDLDAARWTPARQPLPTGGEHVPLDANTELALGKGEVQVTIPRFSLAHDGFQAVDSPKYLTFSTGQFELAPDRPATFAVDLAVENIGGKPADDRLGMAAFHVFDLAVSKRVFAVCGTSTSVFGLHGQLGLGGVGAGEPFYHVVESPYEDFDDDFTRLRACEITRDRTRSTATWRATVKGRFDRCKGTLNASGPAVALTIEADSLNTKNQRRDKHLRSNDFFDVVNHPRVRFEADAADLAGDDLKVRGLLYAAGKRVALDVDARVTLVGEELQIEATAIVDQRRLGMTWSPLGVVRAPSKLTVRGRLIRTEDA